MRQMKCRGIRGAITVEQNAEAPILAATRELFTLLTSDNALSADDMAAVLITCTPDLTAAFPARAIRESGYGSVPLMCSVEMDVPGALPRCIRIMLMVNTEKSASELKHIYLKGAQKLRPEFAR
jgi:chorismate mutase